MEFSKYVPQPVKDEIQKILEGDESNPFSYEVELASVKQDISNIEQRIEESMRRGEEYVPRLCQQNEQKIKRRDMLERGIECLQRLESDMRMPDVFSRLSNEFSDAQWHTFIRAAWYAQGDYASIREKYKLATILKDDIADAADNLANLIHKFSEIGVDVVGEFHCVPELLMKTNVNEMPVLNVQSKFMRKHILEYQLAREMDDDEIRFRALGVGVSGKPLPPECFQEWCEFSPSLSELLGTLSNAARKLKPNIGGLPDAVITRQKNATNEYVRAFALRLLQGESIIISVNVMHAIVNVTNVVINQPDVDVSYDDVRKVVAKLI